MSLRPNIESLELDGTNLVIRGESEKPLPDMLRVIVMQNGAKRDGRCVEDTAAKKIGVGWRAVIRDAEFIEGPAETMGIEVRVDPFEICSWVQSLEIK